MNRSVKNHVQLTTLTHGAARIIKNSKAPELPIPGAVRHRSVLPIVCLAMLLGYACPLKAQVEQIGNMIGVPPEIHEIRAVQGRLAVESGIDIRVKDEGRRSSTMITGGVPIEMRDKIISTEHDLIDLLDELYPYYGFTGSETLEFQRGYRVFSDMQYQFLEYIDGIETSVMFTVLVDIQTRKISWFRGWLELDRDLDPTPALSKREAIDIALCVVQESDQFRAEGYWLDGPHEAEVVYEGWGEGLAPSWRVTLAPPEGSAGAWTESFAIGPNGEFRR